MPKAEYKQKEIKKIVIAYLLYVTLRVNNMRVTAVIKRVLSGSI